MNRRTFLNSILSTLLYITHRQLSAAEALVKKDSDFFKVANLEKNNTTIMVDPVFLEHHIGPTHPESPSRIQHIERALIESNLFEITKSVGLKNDIYKWIETVHTKNHIKSIRESAPIANKVATAAVNAALSGVDSIMNNNSTNVFCATRPPGHHALNTGREEGFCYYNHVAIAAKYAQEKYNLKRILIIDWDYHHGNSTEAIFYTDPSVLFFSTHDKNAYPGTGDPLKTGSGDGEGYNINVHLPCGTSDKIIIKKFNEILLPKARKFKPDLVLISAGFDSRKDDLLGCFSITDSGFIELTKIAMTIANEFCNNRLVSVLEGGYNLDGNAKAVVAHVSTLKNNMHTS